MSVASSDVSTDRYRHCDVNLQARTPLRARIGASCLQGRVVSRPFPGGQMGLAVGFSKRRNASFPNPRHFPNDDIPFRLCAAECGLRSSSVARRSYCRNRREPPIRAGIDQLDRLGTLRLALLVGFAPYPAFNLLERDRMLSPEIVHGLSMLGGIGFASNNRILNVASLRIRAPYLPTDVLPAVSSREGALSEADALARDLQPSNINRP